MLLVNIYGFVAQKAFWITILILKYSYMFQTQPK